MKEKIFIYARDLGGANAIGVVIEKILKDYSDQIELKVYADGLGYQNWKSIGLPVEEMTDETPVETLITWADVVFTANSALPNREYGIWQMAKDLNTPYVAYVDSWICPEKRFMSNDMKGKNWPDRIAAIDPLNEKELLAEGAREGSTTVVGQPFLERRAKELQVKIGSKHPPTERSNILYLSQPPCLPEEAQRWGFDEHDAFTCIVEVLNHLTEKQKANLHLLVRPHPFEDVDIMKEKIKALKMNFEWSFEHGKDPDETIAIAHIVLGTHTMLLVEAALAGKKVISVQPGLRTKDPFVLSRLGYCQLACDAEALEKMILDGLNGGWEASRPGKSFADLFKNSCDRIINLLLSMSEANKSTQENHCKTDTHKSL